jgi:hypothetical protein
VSPHGVKTGVIKKHPIAVSQARCKPVHIAPLTNFSVPFDYVFSAHRTFTAGRFEGN